MGRTCTSIHSPTKPCKRNFWLTEKLVDEHMECKECIQLGGSWDIFFLCKEYNTFFGITGPNGSWKAFMKLRLSEDDTHGIVNDFKSTGKENGRFWCYFLMLLCIKKKLFNG